MTNAEIITALRCCASTTNIVDECERKYCGYNCELPTCIDKMMRDAADALEADEKRIAQLEDALLNDAISNPERLKIYGYRLRDLILFADMCKRNNVKEEDMKQAAWNLELAVRAWMNERQEIVKNTMNDIVMRFTPDFEKEFAEMRGEEQC